MKVIISKNDIKDFDKMFKGETVCGISRNSNAGNL